MYLLHVMISHMNFSTAQEISDCTVAPLLKMSLFHFLFISLKLFLYLGTGHKASFEEDSFLFQAVYTKT